MLFTTCRLRRCCFPSKEADTEKEAGAIQYLGTYSRRKNESRGKDFTQVFLCLTTFYINTPPEVLNNLEELQELSLRDPDHLPPGVLKDADWHDQQCKDF